MIDSAKNTVRYFQAPANYFWQWAEKGNVIEWRSGATICYRDELAGILQAFTNNEFPPLGPILLVLAACNNSTINTKGKFFLKSSLKNYPAIEKEIKKAWDFLEIIAALPYELRTGQARLHLMFEIFTPVNFLFNTQKSQHLIDDLKSGQLDQQILQKGTDISTETIVEDLKYLELIYEKYPTTAALELKLRTSLRTLAGVPEISLPEPPLEDLMDQLLDDPKTAGAARLAQRLIAALNIPMHVHGSSNQSYGGISDITNRGNYDRLLLSELAQEDAVLTARLVNNEALYFRREEPPVNQKKSRILLVDTTIKMWGIPKVFALSVALACSRNTHHSETVQAFSLQGNGYSPSDLFSRQGIIKMLEHADPSLHCGAGLQHAMSSLPAGKESECFFITAAGLFQDATLHAMIADIVPKLAFIVTVNRNGELLFYECINGRTRQLSYAKFNLEELLFSDTGVSKIRMATGLPAFLRTEQPLFLPTVSITFKDNRAFYHKDAGVLGITDTQRLLYWKSRENGAIEVLPYIEQGDYFFGYDEQQTIILLVKSGETFLVAYSLKLSHGQVFAGKINQADFSWPLIKSSFGYTFIKTSEAALTIPDNGVMKKIINNGYATLLRIKKMYIDRNSNRLALDTHYLLPSYDGYLKWTDEKNTGINHLEAAPQKEETWTENLYIKFTKWIWHEGSETVVDSRGLLHLKSSDKTIPQITIVLVLGKTTACWAADGAVCGSSYFVKNGTNKMSEINFYEKYIKRFIERLL